MNEKSYISLGLNALRFQLHLIIIFFLSLSTSAACASGWTDYELQIDPEFMIIRANSLDVGLCDINGEFMLAPTDYANVGPIVEYAVTNTHIFTHNQGRKPRNLFAGDTFEDIDSSRNFFFIVDKTSKTKLGPFDSSQFHAQPAVASATPIQWKTPKNPNTLRPLAGGLMFLGYTIFIFKWHIALAIIIIVTPVLSLLFLSRIRKQKNIE